MVCHPLTTTATATTAEAARIDPHPIFRLIIPQETITRTIAVSEITTRGAANPTTCIDLLHHHPDRGMSAEALLDL